MFSSKDGLISDLFFLSIHFQFQQLPNSLLPLKGKPSILLTNFAKPHILTIKIFQTPLFQKIKGRNIRRKLANVVDFLGFSVLFYDRMDTTWTSLFHEELELAEVGMEGIGH